MSFWDPILALFRLPKPKKRRSFEVDEDIYLYLEELAIYERRPARELANDLLVEALEGRRVTERSLEFWRVLSRRQQEVAALICRDYTSPDIALRLGISRETVKTHASNILMKGLLRNRQELRVLFAGWDFSAWE
ncbi:MAG TPA: helix-turn-helix transcriptional regulator [Anaerolineaceae bacterium]|jgi:DNA-binding CsgD family transcriptional regulator